MTASWLFLGAALWGAWFTWNGYRPIYRHGRLSVVSFFAGWLTTELALHHIAWQVLFAAGFIASGALAAWPGWLALGISLVSWAGLGRIWWRAREAEAAVEQGLADGLGADYRARILPEIAERFAPGLDWKQLLLPVPVLHPEVERTRDVVYHEVGGLRLKLDVYRRRDHPTACPVLLQVHGGAWVVGSKKEQGLPLMMHLASRGWLCVSIDYRLAPKATFPDPLVDCKAAIRWIREHAAEYGGDPDFVVVTGGSAGGHLSSLVALTANDPTYQPGFEEVDTRVAGCVAFYGVYDFTNAEGNFPHGGLERLLERHVLKSTLRAAPDDWRKASPVFRVAKSAPPFFIIHGDRDTLAPVKDARRFAATLRAQTTSPVVYAEIPGAQHAFEIFPSARATFVVHGVERFLSLLYSDYLVARRGQAAAS